MMIRGRHLISDGASTASDCVAQRVRDQWWTADAELSKSELARLGGSSRCQLSAIKKVFCQKEKLCRERQSFPIPRIRRARI